MNSAVGTVFNFLFLNKVVVGVVNSSALCLPHYESMCMNRIVTVHTRWKKKEKKKGQNQNADAQYA